MHFPKGHVNLQSNYGNDLSKNKGLSLKLKQHDSVAQLVEHPAFWSGRGLGSKIEIVKNDSVAQLVEQYTFNVWVLGSNPSGITKPPQKWRFFIF